MSGDSFGPLTLSRTRLVECIGPAEVSLRLCSRRLHGVALGVHTLPRRHRGFGVLLLVVLHVVRRGWAGGRRASHTVVASSLNRRGLALSFVEARRGRCGVFCLIGHAADGAIRVPLDSGSPPEARAEKVAASRRRLSGCLGAHRRPTTVVARAAGGRAVYRVPRMGGEFAFLEGTADNPLRRAAGLRQGRAWHAPAVRAEVSRYSPSRE
jgi:hypothetical protein